MLNKSRFFVTVFLVFCLSLLHAAPKAIVVDINGQGDFTSIQDALNSLSDTATTFRVIYIRNGVYREKIYVDKNFVALIGEDKNNTQILFSQARDIWRCANKDDWGTATVNMKGSDIVLENLTIANDFGFELKQELHIDCPLDTANPFKVVRKSSHQMALRTFSTTRLIARNCIFRAYGGDTVSPWNTSAGQFYFKDCEMEGGVDFYCPRGWAYAENCVFTAHGNVAAIWHDGSAVKSSKTVLKNCVFKGEDGFKLGRYHRDAQFYLLNCSFASNMADAPIYLNPSIPANNIQWGHRVYFFNCHKTGGDYPWFANNLNTAESAPSESAINADWTFAGLWHPTLIVFNPLKNTTTTKTPLQKNAIAQNAIDSMAERMLVYQRAIGGWPKAVNEVKVDYKRSLTDAEIKSIRADSMHKDATIDNEATSKEIRYLVKAYRATKNTRYLQAAEKGITYFLVAQNKNGGWPQYYPDASLYRAQITYNDNAMINVLNILADIAERKNDFELIDASLVAAAANAVDKGVQCILNTQIKVNGKLTVWCAQYNPVTLVPEMARKFELVSLSGSESVGIVRFLMRIKKPSPQIKLAVDAAVEWFKHVAIKGINFVDLAAPSAPKGKDRVVVADSSSTIWARFYEIETNKPFFSGRNSIKKYDVSEIEYERRNGYAWYGTWPANLVAVDYPKWKDGAGR